MSRDPSPIATAIAERRLALRVPVGRSVRVWRGLRRLPASLIDLSLVGARVRCEEPVTAGRTLWLWLPAGMGGRWPHPVRAEVVWAESVPGHPTGFCDIATRFRPLLTSTPDRLFRALAELLDHGSDRRVAGRIPYGRHVIARGAGSPRVLIGQDLSGTGMRIDGCGDLPIGTELQLALHAGGRLAPLVVAARVVRWSRPNGAGLEFVGLDEEARDHLSRLLLEHPLLHGPDGRPALVVSAEPAAA